MLASPLNIKRETEFYQGYIRFKMSVANDNPTLIADVTVDFIFDENLLSIAEHDGYDAKNGKILLGNIYGGKSKTISILFEPLNCAKAADIKCQVNYADHNGNMDTVWMDPKEISVVCPIMETDQDINIGRLKEFIEKLPVKDSRVYEIQGDFNVEYLSTLAREVVEKQDVRHVRTLHTRDGKACEIWYYAMTKVTKNNIIIKISILNEYKTMELFAATHSAEALTGLLAEVGRGLKNIVEDNTSGRGKVVNVQIKDSVVQRSNLLDMCNIDGTCDVNIVIEDSAIQRNNIVTMDEGTGRRWEESERLHREKEEHEQRLFQKKESQRSQDKTLNSINDVDLLLNRAFEYASNKKYDQALQVFSKVTEIEPNNIVAWSGLASMNLGLGELDKSIKCNMIVLSSNPSDVTALLGIGIAHFKQGDYGTALKFLDKVLQIDHTNLQAKKLKDMISDFKKRSENKYDFR